MPSTHCKDWQLAFLLLVVNIVWFFKTKCLISLLFPKTISYTIHAKNMSFHLVDSSKNESVKVFLKILRPIIQPQNSNIALILWNDQWCWWCSYMTMIVENNEECFEWKMRRNPYWVCFVVLIVVVFGWRLWCLVDIFFLFQHKCKVLVPI